MPSASARFEARNQARAIPLVTVSLASGHLRQTRIAHNLDQADTTAQNQDRHQEQDTQEVPPPYDSINRNNDHNQVSTRTPNNKDVTEAVLNLSRTLVTNSTAIPKNSPSSSWFFMMIYNWTHTQQSTTTRLFHILTNPTSFVKGINSQNDLARIQQYKEQRKSIQQMTDEQDKLEDDPDMLTNATEMVPVSMMNIKNINLMRDSLPEPGLQGMDIDSSDDVSDDNIAIPGNPRRRIHNYRNPFGTGVDSDVELEDDEGWFGRGEGHSEDGQTKTNSVMLTSTSQIPPRKPSELHNSSLGLAMDPRQFENDIAKITNPISHSTPSLFNTPRNRSANSRSSNVSHSVYSTNAGIHSSSTISTSSSPTHTSEQQQQQQEQQEQTYDTEFHEIETSHLNNGYSIQSELHSHPSLLESPWSETSSTFESSESSKQLLLTVPDIVLSTSATAINVTSTVISTSTSEYSIPSPSISSSSLSSQSSIQSLGKVTS
ncbi:hypothetical protein BGZ76_008515 [Entomortierella beljakovae]|nr:hypothetical protein BGZ76_008515 [Entomortierella beljakovae]